MIARLDRLLHRVGQDVVVQGGGAPPRPARVSEMSDLYERHVFGALKAVAPEERECIELTYFDGLSVDEVACRCGISIQAVEERVQHGLELMVLYLRAHP